MDPGAEIPQLEEPPVIDQDTITASLSTSSQGALKRFLEIERTKRADPNDYRLKTIKLMEGGEPASSFNMNTWTRTSHFDMRKELGIHGKTLDIGSGSAEALGQELAGVVPDEDITYIDIERFPQRNFVQADSSHIPFQDGSIDTIYASNYTADYKSTRLFIDEVLKKQRVLKPDGTVILVPHGGESGKIGAIMEHLAAIRDSGIDIGTQCELVVGEAELRQERLGLQQDVSRLYIVIHPGQLVA